MFAVLCFQDGIKPKSFLGLLKACNSIMVLSEETIDILSDVQIGELLAVCRQLREQAGLIKSVPDFYIIRLALNMYIRFWNRELKKCGDVVRYG